MILTQCRAHDNHDGVRELWTVYAAIDIDVVRAVVVSNTCNAAIKGVPGDVVCTVGLDSEGVWVI